jgi:hypothetical protein
MAFSADGKQLRDTHLGAPLAFYSPCRSRSTQRSSIWTQVTAYDSGAPTRAAAGPFGTAVTVEPVDGRRADVARPDFGK